MIKLSDDVFFFPDEQGGYIKFNGKIWRPVEENKPCFIPTIFLNEESVSPVEPQITPSIFKGRHWSIL